MTVPTLLPAKNNMTIHKIYKTLTDTLKKSGADSPDFDAFCLMNNLLGIERIHLLTEADREISEDDADTLMKMCTRRAQGEPLQYILGSWEFFGRKFYVGEGVLIPRDDTEVVLRSTFPFLDSLSAQSDVKILDLCSGSGIIAITLKCLYENAQVTAVEISDPAIEYLRRNAKENNADIRIIHDDIFACVNSFADSEFDLIISNPPYVCKEDMENLQKEVTFEPALALEGGDDGCDFYRKIVPLYTPKLKNGGMLAFEYDGDQAFVIRDIMTKENYRNICIFDDIGGIHRAINGTVHRV